MVALPNPHAARDSGKHLLYGKSVLVQTLSITGDSRFLVGSIIYGTSHVGEPADLSAGSPYF